MNREHRNTPQRRLIREILRDCSDHPTAEQILARARGANPRIGFGTVYRNLSVLTETGEILRLPMPAGGDRYDGNTARHGHFVCSLCGVVSDVVLPPELLAFSPPECTVTACLLLAEGCCARCQNPNETKKIK